nr:hypothetical protein [Tanacetum cinerariifolium]
MDDLYNNLKVYEANIKGKSRSGSNSHNLAFVSSENTSSINETVTAAHDISTVEHIDTDNLEEMDLKWQEPVGFDKTKVECYNSHRRGHFARECRALRNQGNMSADNERRVVLVETPASALVVQDGLGGYDWSYQAEEGPTNFILMAHSSDSANSSNSKVESCSNECLQSLKNLQKQYDQQKEIQNRAYLEILVRDMSIKDLKNQLEETMKEKDDLKEKLTKFEESSKNLTKLINSQMSANDKISLGYDSQLIKNEMPKCKIFKTGSDSCLSEIDEDNNQAKDRYKVGIGYHVVPPPYTGNYMPPRDNLSFTGLNDSVFKFKISETRTSVNENESIASKSGDKTREEPKTVRSIATKSGQVLVNAAKQNSAASTSTTRPKVNTTAIRPNMNVKSSYFKPHFLKRRHFNKRSAAKTNTFSRNINNSKGKNVTTAGPKTVVNATKGKKEIVVKTSAEYQEIDGGFAAFGGSPKE